MDLPISAPSGYPASASNALALGMFRLYGFSEGAFHPTIPSIDHELAFLPIPKTTPSTIESTGVA